MNSWKVEKVEKVHETRMWREFEREDKELVLCKKKLKSSVLRASRIVSAKEVLAQNLLGNGRLLGSC